MVDIENGENFEKIFNGDNMNSQFYKKETFFRHKLEVTLTILSILKIQLILYKNERANHFTKLFIINEITKIK